MPMPGPMAARPYAKPAPIAALAAFWSSAESPAWATRTESDSMWWCSCVLMGGELVGGSVLGVGGETDVHRGEDREDVGLQDADEHLERGEEQQHRERQDRHRLEQELLRLGEQHGVRQQRECDEQHVPGEHVGEESDGQAERAQDDVREELDEAD